VRLADGGRARSPVAVVLVAATVVSLASVLALPAGHPIRVVAGLGLFIILPGVGVEIALLRPQTPMAPWERLALVGALGLASSGLASVLLAVTGIPLTETSVGAVCATIVIVGSLVSLVDGGSATVRQDWAGTLRLTLTLALVVSGGMIASVVASHEDADHFTILALEDPIAAQAATRALTTPADRATIGVIVESHEAEAADYQLSVGDGDPSPPFRLQPSERRVMKVDVTGVPKGPIEIRLLKSGREDRSLRLTAR
jgi:uncharacterized membrane protein